MAVQCKIKLFLVILKKNENHFSSIFHPTIDILHNYPKTKYLLPHLTHEIKLIICLFLLNYQQ